MGVKYAQFSLVAFDAAALVLTNANSYVWNTLRTFRHQARQVARRCYPTASSPRPAGARGRPDSAESVVHEVLPSLPSARATV